MVCKLLTAFTVTMWAKAFHFSPKLFQLSPNQFLCFSPCPTTRAPNSPSSTSLHGSLDMEVNQCHSSAQNPGFLSQQRAQQSSPLSCCVVQLPSSFTPNHSGSLSLLTFQPFFTYFIPFLSALPPNTHVTPYLFTSSNVLDCYIWNHNSQHKTLSFPALVFCSQLTYYYLYPFLSNGMLISWR